MHFTRNFVMAIGVLGALIAGASPATATDTAKPTPGAEGDWADPGAARNTYPPFKKVDQLPGPRPFSGHGPGYYGLYDAGVDGVYVRQGAKACYDYPSQLNCYWVDKVYPGQMVWVRCQRLGQTVGRNGIYNPYWVYIHSPNGVSGYFASYHINNATNRIDGVPDCP